MTHARSPSRLHMSARYVTHSAYTLAVIMKSIAGYVDSNISIHMYTGTHHHQSSKHAYPLAACHASSASLSREVEYRNTDTSSNTNHIGMLST